MIVKKVVQHWGRDHPGEQLPEDNSFYQLLQLPDPLYVDTALVRRILADRRRLRAAAAAG